MTGNKTEKQSRLHSKIRREVPLVELCLENVTYAPITAGQSRRSGRTTVCKSITTTIAPYRLTGWMGKSGSGKSSLCSVAAGLTQPGDLLPGSVIKVNGEEGRIPKRLVGVVWQDDLLLSNLTVQENLYFAARLKTPEDTPDSVVRQTVEETMEELSLTHVRDSLVGNPTVAGLRGVSGGERKRVAVGAELVVRPSLLICDEPTSGLDSTTAYALIATLKELASIGHSIAVVIHQPRTTIFNLLDHLLLLSKGRTIFDGHPSQTRSYLEACDFVQPLPPETGIADWMMDVITEDEQRKDGSQLAEHWQKFALTFASSEQKNDLHSNSKVLEHRMSTIQELSSVPQYHTSFRKQLSLLTQRTSKQQRGERLTMASLVLQLTYLFFTSLFWWRMPNDTSTIFPRNSLLFFMLIAQSNGIVISAVTVFQRERALLSRERAKKMYTVSSYFLAKTVSDMTNNVLLPLLYSMIVYWTAGFRVSAKAYFSNIFAFYWTFSTAQSMGLFLSILIPNPQLALVLAPPITLFFMIMGGFYIPFQNMHAGIQWASYLSFARYGYSALVISEYEGLDIPCSDDEDVAVTVGVSGECPLPGEEVIAGLGIYGIAQNFWFNIGMVILLQILFRIGAYIILRRSR